MIIARTRAELADALQSWAREGGGHAFVPTMGALHDGHLALVRAALQAYPRVVASVFVNPTQFDRADDLAAYPRQPARDADLLADAGAQVLFMPDPTEVYARDYVTPPLPDLRGLDTRYEGARRPGHFAGVVQVVRRLVGLVRPAAMYMGQKDAQQVAVLRRAAAVERWPLAIVAVPTVREPSGLAMSSRNGRLSASGFARAQLLHAVLRWACDAYGAGVPPSACRAEAMALLQAAGFEPEYADLVWAETFEPLGDDGPRPARAGEVLLVAVAWLEGVRLIDNLAPGRLPSGA